MPMLRLSCAFYGSKLCIVSATQGLNELLDRLAALGFCQLSKVSFLRFDSIGCCRPCRALVEHQEVLMCAVVLADYVQVLILLILLPLRILETVQSRHDCTYLRLHVPSRGHATSL